MRVNKAEKLRRRVHELAESMGNLFVETFHYLALFAIGAVTAWAAVMEFLQMVEKGNISIDDILLLFIYLELGAMVGIYFKTKVYVTNNSFQCAENFGKRSINPTSFMMGGALS